MDIFKSWQNIIEEHRNAISCFLASEQSVCQEFDKSKKDREIEKHNVFRIISDLYYRENFHSDLLCYFLNPKENHGCGNIFLSEFIRMLNRCGATISVSDYLDANAVREQGRVDIMVFSPSSKKAIVIENKIHDAPDMQRQLPRYYDYVTQNLGYLVDAIVYIPLDVTKSPDKSDWSELDKSHIDDSILKIIPAYSDRTKINLVLDWLEPAILLSNNIDVISTLRQYSELIKLLNHNYMDTIVMEMFYDELMKSDNLKTAQSIRNMMNELPLYMVNRIIKKYEGRCAPFSGIRNWQNATAYMGEDFICGVWVKIDISCSESGYIVRFWECGKGEQSNVSGFKELVGKIRCLSDSEKNNEFGDSAAFKYFDFTDEKGMFVFVDGLLNELAILSAQSDKL
jgi:hypothetical protein